MVIELALKPPRASNSIPFTHGCAAQCVTNDPSGTTGTASRMSSSALRYRASRFRSFLVRRALASSESTSLEPKPEWLSGDLVENSSDRKAFGSGYSASHPTRKTCCLPSRISFRYLLNGYGLVVTLKPTASRSSAIALATFTYGCPELVSRVRLRSFFDSRCTVCLADVGSYLQSLPQASRSNPGIPLGTMP